MSENYQQMSFTGEQEEEQSTVFRGGFPCQPHSLAGKRKASCDDRDLWPEFRRVIGEIKPKWVVGENVLGLLSSESGRFFGRILRDLAEMGYDAAWCVTSAAEVGAVHRRERVAIIAHADREPLDGIRLLNSVQVRREENGLQKVRSQAREHFEQLRINKGWVYCGNEESIKPLVTRKDDGFSRSMDRNKCLGNAVVPQQFYPIFKAIAELEASR